MVILTHIHKIDIGTQVYKLGNEKNNRVTYSDNTTYIHRSTDMQKTVVIQDTTDLQKHQIYTEQ
jgi:hypothetical protein